MSVGARTVRILGRDYRVIPPSLRDPRLHVAAVLLTLQVLGQTVLEFRLSVAQILVCLAAGALIEFGVGFFKDHLVMWPASGLLTGNSTAFILRTPGTLHGHWWSLQGIWIFLGVVAVSMASKYLIRWHGRHIFNPSNLGLVLAFVALGPQYTEPQDLWWIPLGPWMYVTYAILVGGGLLIAWELRLIGLELGFMVGFAAFVALALAAVPDHCMVASWRATPMCGTDLWQVLVTSPEVLVFALFMVPDPRTVPDGQAARFAFGVGVALLSVLLLGPTNLEFWTKTAILASLVIACAGRFALARLLASTEPGGEPLPARRRLGGLVATVALALFGIYWLPVAAELSTHGPEPAAELSDGSTAKITLVVGSGPGLGTWIASTAAAALPPSSDSQPAAATTRVYIVPPLPKVGVPETVTTFDPSVTPQAAAAMAHDVVLDLLIESEARRAHDLKLAESGASGDGLQEFIDVINQDIKDGKIIEKTYSFSQVDLTLFLPKFATQAPRLVGVTLHGTANFITLDASGRVLSQTSAPYAKSWGLGTAPGVKNQVIINDYTDLAVA
jgi:hypothetical protein